MSLRHWLAAPALVAAAAVSGGISPSASRSPAQAPSSSPSTARATQPSAPAGVSTLGDQVDLGVTVYNSSVALVRDTRDITLPSGVSTLQFEDIAATVNPATVHFRSLTDPSHLSVLEQNYEYDLLDPDKLLRKYVGRDVTLVRHREVGGETRDEDVTARLLSDNASPVWQIGNEIVTGLGADSYRFPDLPDNLHARPTLIWSLENDGAAHHRVEASYLANDLSWNADYVLTVARDDHTADLDGWVTLRNGSGTAFRNATLQLVAGALNRVGGGGRGGALPLMAASGERSDLVTQENFSEYHLYTVARRTTIENDETKQISLLSATKFPVEKRYVVNGQPFSYRNATPGAPSRVEVQTFYGFTNEEQAGLGMPLPAGTVRVYQADSRGALQFAGEDRIDHTPKDEAVNLHVGNAFDIVAERKQTDFERLAPNVFESEYEITIRNHKTDAVTVEVNEPIGGSWQMLQASLPWTKTAAFAAQFMMPVAAGGTATLTYRVRVTY